MNCRIIFRLLCLIIASPFFLFSQPEEGLDSIQMFVDVDEVVVTAQYAPTHSKNALQNIRTINRETIERQGATNLEQLLQQDLSIRIQQDLILGSSMSLLGQDGENVKIMIDGVPVIGRLDGNIDLSQLNLNNIERVEIVEGPMSVAYGTDALAGVINLITKKSQLSEYELTLSQQIETRGENNSILDAGWRIKDDWLLRFSGGRDQFGGFDEQDVRSSVWNPKDQWYFDASLRRNFGEDHHLRYQLSFFDEEVQNLGAIRRPEFKPYAFDDFFLTKRIGHTLAHEGTVAKNFFWQTVAGYNEFEREVNSYRLDFEPDDSNLIGGDTTTFSSYMLRSVLASKFESSALNFQLGVDLRYEDGSGARLIDPATDRPGVIGIGDYALFGSLRFQPASSLMLEAGLRTMHNTRYQAPLIPSVHLKYDFSKALTVRASYGKGFRSPSLKELFLSFIDINHFIIGNADLQVEQSDNIQLNFNYRKKFGLHRINARLHAFYNSIDNQILLFPFVEQNGALTPVAPNASTTFAYFNMDQGKNKGWHFRLEYQYKGLSLEGGVLHLGYFNPLSETLSSVSPFTYSTELNGRIAYQLPFSGTDISVFVRHNDRFISFYPETTDGQTVARQRIQEGFTMVDASLSQNFFDDRLTLSAGVRNLMDIRQIGVTGGGGGAHSSGNGAPVGVGRSFFVRAAVHLPGKEKAKNIASKQGN